MKQKLPTAYTIQFLQNNPRLSAAIRGAQTKKKGK
jgi:hypothetical protein